MTHRGGVVFCLFLCLNIAASDNFGTGLKLLKRIYDKCERSQEVVKCFKVQAAKLADRAARMDSISLMDGISLVKREEAPRSFAPSLPDMDLNTLSAEKVDQIFDIATSNLLQTHKVIIAPSFVGDDLGRSMSEARGKLKKLIGPIIAGVAIKGGFLAMAFQAIALIAGKALLIGKIALLLSAIIGLKKLVSSGEAHEKTTYEIVKHPQVSQSHTYSSSHYGGDFDPTGPGGHYRRSVEDEAAAQDRAYNAHVKKQ